MSAGVRRAARSVRGTAHDVAARQRRTQVAIVRQPEPLQVELSESNLVLDEGDVSFGQAVRRYLADKGLEEGDSLMLVPLPTGDYVAVEVLSEAEPPTNVEAKGYVEHGSDGAKARPKGFDSVEWHGTAEPTNAVDHDVWIDATAPFIKVRHSGSWVAL